MPATHGSLHRRIGAVVLVSVCALVALIAFAWRRPTNWRDASSDRATHWVRDEFVEIADRIRDSANVFHGYAALRDCQRRLAAIDSMTPAEQVELFAELGREQVRLGYVEEALESFHQAFALVDGDSNLESFRRQLHYERALAWLRAAEEQNCIGLHCAQSCIFPIERGGIHKNRDAAEAARADLLACLAYDPPNPGGLIWLLNVVQMTLGEWPHGVPEQFLLAPSLFESTADVPRFENIATQLGINRLSLAGGALVEDFDGDGLLDIVSSSMDPYGPLLLFRNQGNGRFERLADEAGLAGQLGGLHCVAADYDNDGHVDILVLRGAWLNQEGRIRNSLLRNNGDGTFTDVTHEARLAEPPRPTQVGVWADFDRDGWLDLFVGNESLAEHLAFYDNDESLRFPSQLFRNNGDGTFTDVAVEAGIDNDRFCKGAAAGDFNNDGLVDLYVSNYSQDAEFGRNRLYRNNGDGTFTDVAEPLGVVEPRGSFACWFFDYDNDGWLDLLVMGYDAQLSDVARAYAGWEHGAERSRLYRNEQGQRFVDVTGEVGLDRALLVMGASFGDLDNDGWLDLYLGTGGPDYAFLVPNVMYRNDAGRRFDDVTTAGGFGHLQKGHTIVFADLDNDGDQDIYADLGGAYNGDTFSNALFLNPGNDNRYLKLHLVGTRSNRQAVGARVHVTVDTPQGRHVIHRAAGSVSSFGNTPSRMEIGLGPATRIVRLDIDWPSDHSYTSLEGLPLDATLKIVEGESSYRQLDLPALDFEQHLEPAEAVE